MLNIIFQENLNEMIHHAQQKISNTFCQAPAPSQAAPRPRLRFGDLQSPWLAAPEENQWQQIKRGTSYFQARTAKQQS